VTPQIYLATILVDPTQVSPRLSVLSSLITPGSQQMNLQIERDGEDRQLRLEEVSAGRKSKD
jgi:hypothetical protein